MKTETGIGGVLRKVISASKGMSVLTVLVVMGAVVTALFPPLVLERIVNDLTARRPVSLGLALTYPGLIALSGLLEAGQNVTITVFGQKVTHGLRSELCAKLRRLPADYFTRHACHSILKIRSGEAARDFIRVKYTTFANKMLSCPNKSVCLI